MLVLPTYHPVHVAHQVATLDPLSAGRAILGVGLGRAEEYDLFQVPAARRVTRFTESVELIKALWAGPRPPYEGEIYRRGTTSPSGPGRSRGRTRRSGSGVSTPRPYDEQPPGRTAGWDAGGSSSASLAGAVPLLHAALEDAGRDPATFPISKRVFVSVEDRSEVARSEVDRWFSDVYHDPSGTDQCGVFGTPVQVQEQLEALAATGVTHLLLNPVTRYAEQVEALAEIVGLAAT